MKKIYIAGRLNGTAVEYLKNIHSMLLFAEAVRQCGYAVFVPCLDFLMGIIMGNYEYNDYFSNSQPFLEICDAIFVCPNWKTSEGTKKEIERAEQLGIPVYYSLEELKKKERL